MFVYYMNKGSMHSYVQICIFLVPFSTREQNHFHLFPSSSNVLSYIPGEVVQCTVVLRPSFEEMRCDAVLPSISITSSQIM
mmetsp:Transcript_20196/g.29721  ORF Transcript_20196/g.29721 Transcript_20196/m.29721 type:complete len:81 (-) Transcript_20196:2181-2423(-)